MADRVGCSLWLTPYQGAYCSARLRVQKKCQRGTILDVGWRISCSVRKLRQNSGGPPSRSPGEIGRSCAGIAPLPRKCVPVYARRLAYPSTPWPGIQAGHALSVRPRVRGDLVFRRIARVRVPHCGGRRRIRRRARRVEIFACHRVGGHGICSGDPGRRCPLEPAGLWPRPALRRWRCGHPSRPRLGLEVDGPERSRGGFERGAVPLGH